MKRTRRFFNRILRIRGLEGPLFSHPSFIVTVRRVLARSVQTFHPSDGLRGNTSESNAVHEYPTKQCDLPCLVSSVRVAILVVCVSIRSFSSKTVRRSLVTALSIVKSPDVLKIPVNRSRRFPTGNCRCASVWVDAGTWRMITAFAGRLHFLDELVRPRVFGRRFRFL